MPCSRKAGTSQSGGGFGKALASQRAIGGRRRGLEHAKPDVTRLGINPCKGRVDEILETNVTRSKIESNDAEDYVVSKLLMSHGQEHMRPQGERAGFGLNFEHPKRADPAGKLLFQTGPHDTSEPMDADARGRIGWEPPPVSIPLRPYPFRDPCSRVLHLARTVEKLFHRRRSVTNDEGEPVESQACRASDSAQEICAHTFEALLDGMTDDDFAAVLVEYFAARENMGTLLTAEELKEEESSSFVRWRRSLLPMDAMGGVTPYEKNLEYWRELWRTIERSDLIVEILDARNPLLFRSPTLEETVKRQGKQILIMLNKVDFLTVEQQTVWKQFFTRRGLDVKLYSALHQLNRLGEERVSMDHDPMCFGSAPDVMSCEELIEHLNQRVLQMASQKKEKLDQAVSAYTALERRLEKLDSVMLAQIREVLRRNTVRTLEGLRPILWGASEPESEEGEADVEAVADGDIDDDDGKEAEEVQEEETGADDTSEIPETKRDKKHWGRRLKATTVQQPELLRWLLGPCPSSEAQGRPLIGMTGCPNVGKSSVINTMLKGLHRVGVSRTPGKTKHLQTLEVPGAEFSVCDCPGLVWPLVARSKEELLVHGLLSPDNYRGSLVEPVARTLLQMIPEQIGEVYGVTSKFEEVSRVYEKPIWQVPVEALSLVAQSRKYSAAGRGGLPDLDRVCRTLIKTFADGKVLTFCEPPPHTDLSAWGGWESSKWQARKRLLVQ